MTFSFEYSQPRLSFKNKFGSAFQKSRSRWMSLLLLRLSFKSCRGKGNCLGYFIFCSDAETIGLTNMFLLKTETLSCSIGVLGPTSSFNCYQMFPEHGPFLSPSTNFRLSTLDLRSANSFTRTRDNWEFNLGPNHNVLVFEGIDLALVHSHQKAS